MGKTNLPILRKTMMSKYMLDRSADFIKQSDLFRAMLKSIFFTSNIEYEGAITLQGSRLIVKTLLTKGNKTFKNKSRSRETVLVENAFKAIKLLIDTGELTTENIRAVHLLLCEGLLDHDDEGNFRRYDATIQGKELEVLFTRPDDIANEMEELVLRYSTIQEIEDPEQKLFAIFNWKRDFIRIHPFSDGNGRMSRLLLQWILYREGYYVPTFRGWSRKEYHDGMHLAYITKDIFVVRDMYLQEVIVSKLLEDNYETIKDLIPPTLVKNNSEYIEDYFYDNFDNLREIFGWDKTLRVKSYK